MSKENILSVILKKSGDNLVYRNAAEEKSYKQFKSSLEEGHLVHVFFDGDADNGTLTQLAKIKVCIRTLSREAGVSFEDMQLEIKKSSGLCFKAMCDGEEYLFCKSFGDCSKEDLSLAIQAIIEKGDFLGMNLR